MYPLSLIQMGIFVYFSNYLAICICGIGDGDIFTNSTTDPYFAPCSVPEDS